VTGAERDVVGCCAGTVGVQGDRRGRRAGRSIESKLGLLELQESFDVEYFVASSFSVLSMITAT
jgi:hypothetical protein